MLPLEIEILYNDYRDQARCGGIDFNGLGNTGDG